MKSTKIKTVGDLKKALETIPDDFEIKMIVTEELGDEELMDSLYGYPWRTTDSQLEFIDIGYSDKIVKFNAEI